LIKGKTTNNLEIT